MPNTPKLANQTELLQMVKPLRKLEKEDAKRLTDADGRVILKSGVMSKRAQKKHRLHVANIRERYFTLTKHDLTYYEDGGARNQGKLKGRILISEIVDITTVDRGDDSTSFEFCVSDTDTEELW